MGREGPVRARWLQLKRRHVARRAPAPGGENNLDHLTYYTPLQDYTGIITPAPLHFVQQHSSDFPKSMRSSIASRSTAWWTVP